MRREHDCEGERQEEDRPTRSYARLHTARIARNAALKKKNIRAVQLGHQCSRTLATKPQPINVSSTMWTT
jgi:hypothetical protein